MNNCKNYQKTVLLTVILVLSILLSILQFNWSERASAGYLDEKYKYKLSFFRLVYGEWKIEEYIGDNDNSEKMMNNIGKIIEFNPDFLKIDGEIAEGNLYLLCNPIQEKYIDEFIGTNIDVGDKNKELKEESVDFYTLSKVVTRPDNKKMEELKKQIPGGGKVICIKDSDTLILCSEDGYYLLKRTNYIDGVDEGDLINYFEEL